MNVLLVDDETATLRALSLSVPWDDLGFSTVHTASSGKEAIQIMEQYAIALMITDIIMPEMSGLDLISHLHQKQPNARCLLLSGHSDFCYAKEAVHLQVDEYLLKPISTEELESSVMKARDRYLQKWEDVASVKSAEQLLQTNLPYLRNRFFAQLLKGTQFQQDEITRQIQMLSLKIDRKSNVALLLIRNDAMIHPPENNEDLLKEYAITNIINEYFSSFCTVYNCRDSLRHLVFLMISDGQPDLIDTASNAQITIKHALDLPVSVVVSQWGNFFESLVQLYNEALFVVRKSINMESEIIIPVNSENLKSRLNVASLTELYRTPSLAKLAQEGQWDEVSGRIDAIFEEYKSKFDSSDEHLLEIFMHLSAFVLNQTHKCGVYLAEIYDESQLLFQTAFNTKSLVHFRQWLDTSLQHLRKKNQAEIKEERQDIIERVNDYIIENLQHDTSLQSIAETVHLHPVYLSRIYRLYTGENLSNFITRKKMDKAATHLEETDMHIYEISNAIGFCSTAYFCKLFKKHYGVTPQEYRESYSGRLTVHN